jgi:hypothetical protein
MKKKPDRKLLIAVLVLVAGAASAAKGIEVSKLSTQVTKDPVSGASAKWLQSLYR